MGHWNQKVMSSQGGAAVWAQEELMLQKNRNYEQGKEASWQRTRRADAEGVSFPRGSPGPSYRALNVSLSGGSEVLAPGFP